MPRFSPNRGLFFMSNVDDAAKQALSHLPTGYTWLNVALEKSGVPPVIDTGGASMLYQQLSGSTISDEYFQRLPIPYRRVGRNRVYDYATIVEFVKELRARTPVRVPPPMKRYPRKKSAAASKPETSRPFKQEDGAK
jgi:hypothetical protein